MLDLRASLRMLFLLPLLALVAFTTGCDDDDNPTGVEEEHLEAFGVRMLVGGIPMVTADGSDVTGTLFVPSGARSAIHTIEFLDGDGNWMTPESHEDESEEHGDEPLDIQVDDPDRLTVLRREDLPIVPDEWSFVLKGMTEGSTTLRIVVLHEGHEDYVSPWLPVTVTDTP